MYTRVLHLKDRRIISSLPRIPFGSSTTSIPSLMCTFQWPTTVIVVNSLYCVFTSVTSSRNEEFSVATFPTVSMLFNPTGQHVSRALARRRLIVERIVRAIIWSENVVWAVVGCIDALTSGAGALLYTSIC
jgi:hypothetical protein